MPNVPEARVFVPRLDCDLWTDLANVALCRCTADFILGAQCNLLAYQDRLFDGDAEILPDLRAVASRGHCFYVIGTGQDRCQFLGDVVHTGLLPISMPRGAGCRHAAGPADARRCQRVERQRLSLCLSGPGQGSSRWCRVPVSGHHPLAKTVPQGADARDSRVNLITGFQKTGRVKADADPSRRAG